MKRTIIATLLMTVLGTALASPQSTELGLKALAQGEYVTAEDHLLDALADRPGDTSAAEGLVWLRLSRKDVEGASEAAVPLVKYGTVKQALAGAATLKQTGLNPLPHLQSRDDYYTEQLISEWVGSYYLQNRMYEEVVRHTNLGLTRFPNSWRLLAVKATALVELKRFDEAKDLAARLAQIPEGQDIIKKLQTVMDTGSQKATEEKRYTDVKEQQKKAYNKLMVDLF